MPQVLPPNQSQPQVTLYPLTNREPDPNQILRILEQKQSEYSTNPVVREFTVKQLRGLGNNDVVGQAKRVVAFVRQNVVYVRDPEGTEYVVSPVRMITQLQEEGYTAGDCDDHVMLLNSMLGSIGIPTRFLGVKFKSDSFNHVISGVVIGGKMIQVDPCAKSNNQRVYTETLTA